MENPEKNPLARFERRKTNYLLIAVSAVLAVLLFAGIVMAIRSRDLAAALIFLACLAVFVVLVLVNIAEQRRLAAVDDRRLIHWNPEMPELQRQSLDVEVLELARLLNAGDDQIPDLFSAYIIAEDLALRQIQQEENLPIMRHVTIGKTSFDGILVDQDLITCIEVSFVVVPDMRQEKVDAILKKFTQARKTLVEMKSRLRVRLMVVLVMQLAENEEEVLRLVLEKTRFKDMQIDNVEIRFLDFETLQKVYVSE